MKSKVNMQKSLIYFLIVSKGLSQRLLKYLTKLKETDKECVIFTENKEQKRCFSVLNEVLRNTFIKESYNKKELETIVEALSAPFGEKGTELKLITYPLLNVTKLLNLKEVTPEEHETLIKMSISELFLKTSETLRSTVKTYKDFVTLRMK